MSDFLGEVSQTKRQRFMSVRKRKLEYVFRLSLNANGRTVFGIDEAEILEAIEKYGSIGAAAKKLEISYKFTWNRLIHLTRTLRQPMVVTRRGTTLYTTKKGGGGTTLTPVATILLKEFRETERIMRQSLSERAALTVTSNRITIQRK